MAKTNAFEQVESKESLDLVTPVTVYRAVQKESDSGTTLPENVASQIDMESKSTKNIQEITRADGSTMWCAYSKPSWYIDKGNEFKIIDCMVFANSKEDVEKTFDQQIIDAEIRREKAKKIVETEILPRVSNLPGILAIVGRGDTYDPERVPGPESDIDIMLFTNFDSSDVAQKERFIASLQEALAGIENTYARYTYHETSGKGNSGSSAELLPHVPNFETQVGFDIISLKNVFEYMESRTAIKTGGTVTNYAFRAFTQGELLVDKSNGNFEKLTTTLKERVSN